MAHLHVKNSHLGAAQREIKNSLFIVAHRDVTNTHFDATWGDVENSRLILWCFQRDDWTYLLLFTQVLIWALSWNLTATLHFMDVKLSLNKLYESLLTSYCVAFCPIWPFVLNPFPLHLVWPNDMGLPLFFSRLNLEDVFPKKLLASQLEWKWSITKKKTPHKKPVFPLLWNVFVYFDFVILL